MAWTMLRLFDDMRKAIELCLALAIAGFFGQLLEGRTLASAGPPPSPAPTNTAPHLLVVTLGGNGVISE